MCVPCFEAYQANLMIEQIDTADQMDCGGVETLTEEEFNKKVGEALHTGVSIVREV
jgi:hypothetical protein